MVLGSTRSSSLLSACVALTVTGASTAASAAVFGNDVLTGNSATGAINDTLDRRAQRFVATSNLTVDRVHFQFNAVTGAPALEFAVQADNGSGVPDGVDLAIGSATGAGGRTGYIAALNAPLALTAGSAYHVVARATSADASNTATIRILGNASAPSIVNSMSPAGQQGAATGLATSTNGTTYGAPSNVQTTIWGLSNSTTGAAISQPYSTVQITNFGGTTWVGQRFTYTGETGKLDDLSIQLRASATGGSLGDNMRVHIATVATQEPGTPTGGSTAVTSVVPGTELYEGVLVNAGSSLTVAPGQMYAHDIATLDEPTLVNGQSYLLLLETGTAGVSTLPFNQGNDTLTNDFGGAALNFQNMNDGFVVTSSETIDPVTGLPSRFFTSDIVGASLIFRDARFLLDVTPIPEPAGVALLFGAGACLMVCRHRRGA